LDLKTFTLLHSSIFIEESTAIHVFAPRAQFFLDTVNKQDAFIGARVQLCQKLL